MTTRNFSLSFKGMTSLLCLAILFSSVKGFCTSYPFDSSNTQNSASYHETVAALEDGKIKKDDVLMLGSGHSIQIHRLLGHGNQTVVVEGADGRVYRLPKTPDGGASLDSFLEGVNSMRKKARGKEIPLVEVDTDFSDPKHYITVENLPIKFTFQELMEDVIKKDLLNLEKSPKLNLTNCQIKGFFRDFAEFTIALSDFRYIGDLHSGNIGYANGRWIIFDLSGTARRYDEPRRSDSINQGMIIDNIFEGEFVADPRATGGIVSLADHFPPELIEFSKTETIKKRTADLENTCMTPNEEELVESLNEIRIDDISFNSDDSSCFFPLGNGPY